MRDDALGYQDYKRKLLDEQRAYQWGAAVVLTLWVVGAGLTSGWVHTLIVWGGGLLVLAVLVGVGVGGFQTAARLRRARRN